MAGPIGYLRYIIGSATIFAVASVGCGPGAGCRGSAAVAGGSGRGADDVVARERLHADALAAAGRVDDADLGHALWQRRSGSFCETMSRVISGGGWSSYPTWRSRPWPFGCWYGIFRKCRVPRMRGRLPCWRL